MDSLNHVKIMTPDPEAVETFLREVCQIPEGWPIGERPTGAGGGEISRKTAEPPLTWDNIADFGDGEVSGYIVGSSKSRQFQVFAADTARIWGVAIGTRDVDGAYERAVARGISVTEPRVVDWSEEANIHAFFARVGGVTFEVMRVEPKS